MDKVDVIQHQLRNGSRQSEEDSSKILNWGKNFLPVDKMRKTLILKWEIILREIILILIIIKNNNNNNNLHNGQNLEIIARWNSLTLLHDFDSWQDRGCLRFSTWKLWNVQIESRQNISADTFVIAMQDHIYNFKTIRRKRKAKLIYIWRNFFY